MNQKTMLSKVVEQTGSTLEEAQQFYEAFVSVLGETLGQGEEVDCLPDWGRLTPKLRDNIGRNKNSPRRPKKAHYIVQFRPSKSFENMMFAAAGGKEESAE